MLRALKMITDAATKAGKPATVCGELAARPQGALALIGLGFRSLSVSPASIGPLKSMIREANIAELQKAVGKLVEGENADARELLTTLAAASEIA
jgi:phosphotransferase system enzyme I (PtsP)